MGKVCNTWGRDVLLGVSRAPIPRVEVLKIYGTPNYAHTVWLRPTKFSLVTCGGGMCLNKVRYDPYPKGVGLQHSQNFWDQNFCTCTVWHAAAKFCIVINKEISNHQSPSSFSGKPVGNLALLWSNLWSNTLVKWKLKLLCKKQKFIHCHMCPAYHIIIIIITVYICYAEHMQCMWLMSFKHATAFVCRQGRPTVAVSFCE